MPDVSSVKNLVVLREKEYGWFLDKWDMPCALCVGKDDEGIFFLDKSVLRASSVVGVFLEGMEGGGDEDVLVGLVKVVILIHYSDTDRERYVFGFVEVTDYVRKWVREVNEKIEELKLLEDY